MGKTVTEEIYQYTELVYRDESGDEVYRERMHDDSWIDTGSSWEPSESDIEDFYGGLK